MTISKIPAKYGVLIASGMALFLSVGTSLCLTGCKAEGRQPDARAEAPPQVQVETETDVSNLKVDRPEQFPLVPAIVRARCSGTDRDRRGFSAMSRAMFR